MIAVAEKRACRCSCTTGPITRWWPTRRLDLIHRDRRIRQGAASSTTCCRATDPQATRGAVRACGTTGSPCSASPLMVARRMLVRHLRCPRRGAESTSSAIGTWWKRRLVFRYHGAAHVLVRAAARGRAHALGGRSRGAHAHRRQPWAWARRRRFGRRHYEVREALAALKTAQVENEDVVTWADLHHDAFRAAAYEAACSWRRSRCTVRCWRNTTTLTAPSWPRRPKRWRAYGDVRLAGEALHQHPNTVRYRLRKAKDVLGMPDSPRSRVHVPAGPVPRPYEPAAALLSALVRSAKTSGPSSPFVQSFAFLGAVRWVHRKGKEHLMFGNLNEQATSALMSWNPPMSYCSSWRSASTYGHRERSGERSAVLLVESGELEAIYQAG